MWRYFVSLFSKMGDKGGERGVKNLKKWVMLFMDGPFQLYIPTLISFPSIKTHSLYQHGNNNNTGPGKDLLRMKFHTRPTLLHTCMYIVV